MASRPKTSRPKASRSGTTKSGKAPRRKQERAEVSVEKALDAALALFSKQGFGATSMRQISDDSGVSMGNLYHHFPNKEAIFERLLVRYWERLQQPDQPLQKLFARADFPDDLEEMAANIEEVVDDNVPYIRLIYIDVVEFDGRHIKAFYEGMAERFKATYGDSLRARKEAGEFGDVDPLVGVIMATRWFFYFFTVEKCFGAPMHFGMKPEEATREFIRILRYGLLPRSGPSPDASDSRRSDSRRSDSRPTEPS